MKIVRLLLMLMIFSAAATAYASNFTDNGNGTISDADTGLVWQQCSAGYTTTTAKCDTASGTTTFTWADALSYCEGLSLAGQTDWRLPNRIELMSIVDYTRVNPSINTTYFPNVPNAKSYQYWSSTSYADTASYAWYVDFVAGNVLNYGKAAYFYVRCVRGGQ